MKFKTGYSAFVKDASGEEIYRTDVFEAREACLEVAQQSLEKVYNKLIEPYIEAKFVAVPIPKEEKLGSMCEA